MKPGEKEAAPPRSARILAGSKTTPPEAAFGLESPASALKGVGPVVAGRLKRLGVEKAADLLYLLPRRYEDFRHLARIADCAPGQAAVVRGNVLAAHLGGGFRRGGKRLFEAVLADDSGTLTLKYFQFIPERLKLLLAPGGQVVAAGVVSRFSGSLQMVHAELFEPETGIFSAAAGLRPVYPATEGLLQTTVRRLVGQVLPLAARVPPVVPEDVRVSLALPPAGEALCFLHNPPPGAEVSALNDYTTPAHQALIFEELFLFQIGVLLQRRSRAGRPGIAFPDPAAAFQRFEAALSFPLTSAQRRVLAEVAADMARPKPMSRLIQGDVGCGKTAVALAACHACTQAGYQAALMAPTEILAEQHLRSVLGLPQLGFRPVLLRSGPRAAERRAALRKLAGGEANLAVGTHAIIEEAVEFAALGLVVVDEQHRFGVMQRSALLAKGGHPDVLVLSATPIPRTLALTIYGDLDLSVIDEPPPGRQPIKTIVLDRARRGEALDLLAAEVAAGGQAYVVYPLVEESDKLLLKSAVSQFRELAALLPAVRFGLVHGRLPVLERDSVLRAFLKREIDALVATTVVEVGLDVPNASFMLVEDAERFGLSQLHQLRGRVGRGPRPATCVLLAGSKSGPAGRRLAALEKTHDGWRIAEEDLALRGPGEFLGVRQSGLPGFRVADVLRDARLLALARREAQRLIAEGRLNREDALGKALLARWGERVRLMGVG
ncbi:MAG: ATP-dependent DNA helicase RecG [Pseudomonadota bacterium]